MQVLYTFNNSHIKRSIFYPFDLVNEYNKYNELIVKEINIFEITHAVGNVVINIMRLRSYSYRCYD